MFEAVELGNRLDKKSFNEQLPPLRTRLLEVQAALRETRMPVIVIVSGVEGAGKPKVVNRLNEWLDARGIQTHAFWDESDEERERPRYWRFWRKLPPRGTIGIMFGSWYTQPIIDRVYGRIEPGQFEYELLRINEFEKMLSDDGALVIKLWFHITKKEQKRRLTPDKEGKLHPATGMVASPMQKKFLKKYDDFVTVSEEAIRATSSGIAPWHLIEATDENYRDFTAASTVLTAISRRLEEMQAAAKGKEKRSAAKPAAAAMTTPQRQVLDSVDLNQTIGDKDYKKQLAKYQARLSRLAWAAREKRRSSIFVFEGWDAAGKGGAIRRLTGAMDARLYRVISVAAPTDEELAQHYLWRFWRHIPQAGYITIYDRSWYGRVLVERVEQFAKGHEWQRAYMEINSFEQQLSEHGIILCKFWLHISPEEQLRRFQEREKIAYKQYKITDEDWRNRAKWEPYQQAVSDMVTRTSTSYAPWHLIAANDKHLARVSILKSVCERIEQALDA
ncbi:MAG: polyphosphate:AMP phosphotransferase [Thiohalomonadaceae bacterium]